MGTSGGVKEGGIDQHESDRSPTVHLDKRAATKFFKKNPGASENVSFERISYGWPDGSLGN